MYVDRYEAYISKDIPEMPEFEVHKIKERYACADVHATEWCIGHHRMVHRSPHNGA